MPTSVSEDTVRVEECPAAIQEEDLRELVRDRADQVSRRVVSWAMEVADALGELERLDVEDAEDAQQVKKIVAEYRRELAALDCELLDSDTWNPELQRAVKIEQTLPPGSSPQVTQKISFGLRVQGHLVRKQEVCLNK